MSIRDKHIENQYEQARRLNQMCGIQNVLVVFVLFRSTELDSKKSFVASFVKECKWSGEIRGAERQSEGRQCTKMREREMGETSANVVDFFSQ